MKNVVLSNKNTQHLAPSTLNVQNLKSVIDSTMKKKQLILASNSQEDFFWNKKSYTEQYDD